MFEKKFKDFLEEKKDITVVGMGWALFWRVYVVIVAVIFGISLLANLFN